MKSSNNYLDEMMKHADRKYFLTKESIPWFRDVFSIHIHAD